jgi:hypothetical protein
MSAKGITLSGPDLDLEALSTEVERRAGPGPDEAIARAAPSAEETHPESPGSALQVLLSSLAEDIDAAQGFPPQSHRTLGGAVVAAKRGFR